MSKILISAGILTMEGGRRGRDAWGEGRGEVGRGERRKGREGEVPWEREKWKGGEGERGRGGEMHGERERWGGAWGDKEMGRERRVKERAQGSEKQSG